MHKGKCILQIGWKYGWVVDYLNNTKIYKIDKMNKSNIDVKVYALNATEDNRNTTKEFFSIAALQMSPD